jgi:uncharacterized protein YcbK (DUF882 family)
MNLQENIQRIREMMILVEKTDIKMDDTRVVDLNLTPQKNNPDPNEDILKDVDPSLKRIFYNVQSEYGSPLKVTYGKRSIDQNKSAGGVEGSAHLDGLALDIKLDSTCRSCIKKLVNLSSKHGALGIGVYKDADVIHIDIRRGDKRKNGTRAWSNKGLPIPEWVLPEITKHLNQ